MRTAVLFLGLAPLVAAAPVPKGQAEAERIEKLFGKPVDPDKDCKFALDGDKLVITVPDKPHALGEESTKLVNAPRVLQDVKGDFIARVLMECRLPPEGAVFTPYSAGLVAYQDDENFVAMEAVRLVRGPVGQMTTRVVASGTKVGGCGMGDGKADPARRMWLQLARRGGTVEFAVSYDRVTWNWFCPEKGGVLGRDLKVGVYAAHTGTTGFAATFEGFTVEPLTDAKK